MKSRPTLSVLASNDDESDRAAQRKPRLHLVMADDEKDDDDDALEASCDIGETTLRKGQIQINRTGVTFVSRDAKAAKATRDDDDEVAEDDALRKQQSQRQLIALDELETCGMLGRGCSGHVMRAKHRETDALYAIKIMNNIHDKAKRDQMLTEIRTLYSVESAHLVSFYGAYFQDHALSLVLEFCDVGSLDGVIHKRSQTMPEPILAAVARQMLLGLRQLKTAHHFHRDVKPQNILVLSNGAVKLTDFGLARALGDSQDMAQTFVGTFKYMSPERVQNEPYDYKSDIWSLGLVLMECATKTFPYKSARSYIEVVQSIIECAEPELPPNGPDWHFSAVFRAFISDCLKKDPKQRASVDKLLQSPWFELHDALDSSVCQSRIAKWLKKSEDEDDENKYANDEYEIEEDIDEASYAAKEAK